MKRFFVFNDGDGRRSFLDEIPAELDDAVDPVGDRELAVVDDSLLDALLSVPTDEDYVVEEREIETTQPCN